MAGSERGRIAHRKRRSLNQMQGDSGEELVAAAFPRQWLTRKIGADFGIDLHVEVFDWTDESRKSADTLGEHLFVQVKSRATSTFRTFTLHERRNVSKYGLKRTSSGESARIEVLPCVLDVDEILTIEAMGNATPVLLCVATMDTELIYYVCLNDYISRVLLPSNPDFASQTTVTIHIPTQNVLDRDDASIAYLWLLARRSKLYSAFNTFNYQHNEILYLLDDLDHYRHEIATGLSPLPDHILAMVEHFLSSNLRLDIWRPIGRGGWFVLHDVQARFVALRGQLPSYRQPLDDMQMIMAGIEIQTTFAMAANLSRIYEEVVREARLPTWHSRLGSKPQ
ncbi:hypothetical protein NN3_24970 [Nocardia neocaledoniensis NBRC 108232]|nr:DUF4365 domain-containing protein [Nocardia neocaledoniensis]GEM31490.1 hypothetical protein NN3_24970 [Nocardia neocaledoniensis NBRC 108232]